MFAGETTPFVLCFPVNNGIITRVPAEKSQGTGLHWQVSQATSLINIVVHMSTAANTAHQGLFIRNLSRHRRSSNLRYIHGEWEVRHPDHRGANTLIDPP